MGKIFCVMGKSTSGKDTIYKRLLADESLGLKRIVLYTTRPIRARETDGVEYHFCTQEQEEELQKAGKIIEKRTYDTVYGPWDYFTVDDGSVDLDRDDYLIIGTLDSYQSLIAYYSTEQVVPIYIEVDDGIRLQRAMRREQKQEKPRYEEMCRRFLGDAKDFSDDRIRECGITKRFVNDESLDDTVREVTEYIWRLK